ncbi:hypothetical protein PHLCEN_2v10977 [Hermanssonia centrifuga]|uniref:Proteasome activator Blm10 middle HEAT repeats region domain-containing protein n=1 Tax=Hermanssonia centrifuga TaxID=98765 RepID=A0A2R6NLB1_9APHY|nr:hypothetical protein PHLCEN_2v10977 [Hermanssonia centrifuga]
MVLNMVFDYASNNVRTNAVRAIHQLVECIANANPQKTLAKFLPYCAQNIRTELDHGASSVRTTSLNSVALPADATLHWNLAILRGSMFNDGKMNFVPTITNIGEGCIRPMMFSNEIPEMIASIDPLKSGFALDDPKDPRHQYMTNLKRRFGEFLHKASLSLLSQDEENILDAVLMLSLIYQISYYVQLDRYHNELNITRQYANQKVWPRAVLVRRARLAHQTFFHFLHEPEERADFITQPGSGGIPSSASVVHLKISSSKTSQSGVSGTMQLTFDGLRRRTLATLYKALDPGTDDDRMKGALWTLNTSAFAKYAMGEPTLATELIQKLFACQHNEKVGLIISNDS